MSNAASQQRPTTYAQQQEALRHRHEGTGKEITIEIPKEPEVNPEVYRDVTPLLFHGFVSMPAQIGDAIFVFKSTCHRIDPQSSLRQTESRCPRPA